MDQRIRLSVVVPFHRNGDQLRQSLEALRRAVRRLRSDQSAEILVVADGATEDISPLMTTENRERVLAIPGPRGPAVARNSGAAAASGTVLVFVDSDVVVHDDALQRFAERFESEPDVGAIFGAYDENAADPGFISQCRNLSHTYVHQRSSGDARTFWAGVGAVRASLFAAAGGFDERFTRPSVEDIDLGYRLRAAGVRILLDPQIQGTHLKRWTLFSGVLTDIRDRGIPWTQLLPRYGGLHADLNLTMALRLCVAGAWLLVASMAAAVWWRPAILISIASVLYLWWLDRRFYGFLARRRGWSTAARYFPVHIVHHLGNGLSFAIGTLLGSVSRGAGILLPAALPLTPWPPDRRMTDTAIPSKR